MLLSFLIRNRTGNSSKKLSLLEAISVPRTPCKTLPITPPPTLLRACPLRVPPTATPILVSISRSTILAKIPCLTSGHTGTWNPRGYTPRTPQITALNRTSEHQKKLWHPKTQRSHRPPRPQQRYPIGPEDSTVTSQASQVRRQERK